MTATTFKTIHNKSATPMPQNAMSAVTHTTNKAKATKTSSKNISNKGATPELYDIVSSPLAFTMLTSTNWPELSLTTNAN